MCAGKSTEHNHQKTEIQTPSRKSDNATHCEFSLRMSPAVVSNSSARFLLFCFVIFFAWDVVRRYLRSATRSSNKKLDVTKTNTGQLCGAGGNRFHVQDLCEMTAMDGVRVYLCVCV